MKTHLKALIKTVPAIPIYFYLLLLAVTSTSLFIFLMTIVA